MINARSGLRVIEDENDARLLDLYIRTVIAVVSWVRAVETAEFKKAVEDSRTMTSKPENDELLEVRQGKQATTRRQYADEKAIDVCALQAGHAGPALRQG